MTVVRRLFAVICAFCAFSLAAQTRPTTQPTPAPSASPTSTPPVTSEIDQDVNNPRALKLSLEDAMKTTVERNVGISLQRYTFLEAGENLRSSYGIYDWFATGQVLHRDNQTPTVSQFQSSRARSTVYDVGVSQLIPTGATYTIGFNNSVVNQTGGGTFLNPSNNSDLTFALAQPLLRNFGTDVTSRGIYIARNTLGINDDLFRTNVMDTAVVAQLAYLDLVYARQFIDVVKEAAFLARDQARITQIRIDVGASAPLDILQPRVQIATTEQALISAVADVRDAEDRLRQVMHLDPGDWDRPIIPTTPADYRPMTVNEEEAVATALRLRPEMHLQQLSSANSQLNYVFARNQVLPRLDFNLNYSAAGVAGTVTNPSVAPGLRNTGYGDAINQVFGLDYPSWTVGFTLGLPITNIGARAEAKRAEYDVALSRTSEEQERQTIAVGVRATVRAIDTQAKQINASRAAREAAEQNVEAERRRFENGLSTNFQVLQIQLQLSQARASEIQALTGYNKAVAAYHRAVGDLLDVSNIQIQSPKVEEPKIFGRFLERYNWLSYGAHMSQPQPQTMP